MFHLNYLKEATDLDDRFVKKASGRYYTGESAGKCLAYRVAAAYKLSHPKVRAIRTIDPFGGDGRLLQWLIEAWTELGYDGVNWNVSVWDRETLGFDTARMRLTNLAAETGVKIEQEYRTADTFEEAISHEGLFDIVLTNPPWELLKPDRRELNALEPKQRTQYIDQMRAYDNWLALHYPLSQPRKKFAGWGTNLSRVGLETSLRLVRKGGILGAVLPASILADDQSADLRKQILTKHSLLSVTYYPAEAKLYDRADVASITLTLEAGGKPSESLAVTTQHPATGNSEESKVPLNLNELLKVNFVLPVSFGTKLLAIQNRLAQRFPTWSDLESKDDGSLWAGRELDETGIKKWLTPHSSEAPIFVKGRMIRRYRMAETPSHSVIRPGWTPPASTEQTRIIWRDVSRPNQKRRLIATLAQSGWVAGNSLGVAYFRGGAITPLLALLGVMNSLTFEFQLRTHLATGHVSLSSLRKVAVPPLNRLYDARVLARLVQNALQANDEDACLIDAYVAKHLYELTENEYSSVLEGFPKIETDERTRYIDSYHSLSDVSVNGARSVICHTSPTSGTVPYAA